MAGGKLESVVVVCYSICRLRMDEPHPGAFVVDLRDTGNAPNLGKDSP